MMKHRALLATLLLAATALQCLPIAAQTGPDALQLYREGKFADAVTVCIEEITANPKNTESYVVLCWSLVQAKRYEEADTWAEKGRELSRYDPRLIETQGEAKYFRGLNEQALKLFQEYITYAPNGSRLAEVYAYMGEIYLRLARYRHADIAFSAALQAENLNAQWWVRLGYAREMAKDYRNALTAYNRAIELSPGQQDALRGKERTLKNLD